MKRTERSTRLGANRRLTNAKSSMLSEKKMYQGMHLGRADFDIFVFRTYPTVEMLDSLLALANSCRLACVVASDRHALTGLFVQG